jgi:hypothetical protein
VDYLVTVRPELVEGSPRSGVLYVNDFNSNPTPSGVARQLVTFFCFAKKKVTKEKATPARRPFGVPSVAQLVRLPHKLARSATRPRAQTYSSEFPDQFPLLGGAQGKVSQNPKAQRGHLVPTLSIAIAWKQFLQQLLVTCA